MSKWFGMTGEEILELRRLSEEAGGVEQLARLFEKDHTVLENKELKAEIGKLRARLERIKNLAEELK